MIGSFYDPDLDEGCAFEELISFHGGLGGPQTQPFILHPSSLAAPDEEIVGAEQVHGVLSAGDGSCGRNRCNRPPAVSYSPLIDSKEGSVASKAAWAGWVAFAGLLLMILGGLDFFQGLIAVIRDQYYVLGDNGALVFDVSQWGWIMMIWASVLLLRRLRARVGASWARWVAILRVSVNFIAQLGYDGGAARRARGGCTVVALNIVILYALIVRWDEAKAGAGCSSDARSLRQGAPRSLWRD